MLSDLTAHLLREGLKATGDFDETYDYIVEDLFIDEAEEVRGFLNWVKENDLSYGSNVKTVWKYYKAPELYEQEIADLQQALFDLRRFS